MQKRLLNPHQYLAKTKSKSVIVANHPPVKKAENPKSIFIWLTLTLIHKFQDPKRYTSAIHFSR